MKTNYKVAIALVAGAAIGGAAIQGLHAQAKLPVYVVQEIDVSNLESYVREFIPKVRVLVNTFGGRSLTIGGGKVTSIEGESPKSRVVILRWESMEKFQAWYNSAEYKELRKIADKSAKFRIFAVEGVPQ